MTIAKRTLAAILAATLSACFTEAPASTETPSQSCHVSRVIDGDTIHCAEMTANVRLHAIDAPELGVCRGREGRICVEGDGKAAKAHLEELIGSRDLQCRMIDTDRYGRSVMRCSVGAVDLSCAMVEGGFAVERYGVLDC